MVINKILYTLGDIGDINRILALMKRNERVWEYFVYKTADSGLKIGTFEAIKCEAEQAVILGIASTKELARKLLLHIVTKALEHDSDIKSGINKLTVL